MSSSKDSEEIVKVAEEVVEKSIAVLGIPPPHREQGVPPSLKRPRVVIFAGEHNTSEHNTSEHNKENVPPKLMRQKTTRLDEPPPPLPPPPPSPPPPEDWMDTS